jgi:hypothetical protein
MSAGKGASSIFSAAPVAAAAPAAAAAGASGDAASAAAGAAEATSVAAAAAAAAPSWTTRRVDTIRSGEEKESQVLRERCRLFELLGSKWVERGVGFLCINVAPGGDARVVMRSEKVLKVILNAVRNDDL